MADMEAESERIRARIVQLVADHWQAYQRALLFSVIGLKLKREFVQAPIVLADGLRKFLKSWPVVTIVEHPTIREKIGAVPLGTVIPADVSELFAMGPLNRVHTNAMFYPDFWKAFYLPIASRRFVVLPPDEHVAPRVINSAELPEGESYEILKDDLAISAPDAPISEKARAVANNLRAWLRRYGLSEEQFVQRHAAPVVGAGEPKHKMSNPADFAQAFGRLGNSDLARIFIPLDIVQKMFSDKQ